MFIGRDSWRDIFLIYSQREEGRRWAQPHDMSGKHVLREWTRVTQLERRNRQFILQFAMDLADRVNDYESEMKKARAEPKPKCTCMAAELVKLHYYEEAMSNTEQDMTLMRDQMEAHKIQQISREATAEQIRQGLLIRISHGWTIEAEMRSELQEVTREWQASMAVVGRLQRRVNNLVDLLEAKDRKLIVADHNLLHSEACMRDVIEVKNQHEVTIQDMKTRFVDMRGQRDQAKSERNALVAHYEQVIKELNAVNNITEEE